jgi:predicted esterase
MIKKSIFQISLSFIFLFWCGCSLSGFNGERELIETFVNLKEIPEPFGSQLSATIKAKFDAGKIKSLHDLCICNRELQIKLNMDFLASLQQTLSRQPTPEDYAKNPNAVAIPYLIGLLDADNSREFVLSIGTLMQEITGVKCEFWKDGAFWRRWWEKNKTKYSENVQKITIPNLPKTKHGKSYLPFPEAMETLNGQIVYLRQQFEPKNGKPVVLREGHFSHFKEISSSMAEFDDPKAIPYLIASIVADQSYITVSRVGYAGLSPLTGVRYSCFHDGAFWQRWWEKNKSQYPKEIQDIEIPVFPKTKYGQTYQPYPDDIETLQGQLRFFQAQAKKVKKLSWHDPLLHSPSLSEVACSIAEFNDPTVIPYLIAIIDYDKDRTENFGNGNNDLAYIAGYFGLRAGFPPLTDVKWDESHNGDWWRKWWEENKKNYPQAVQNIPIPSMDEAWNIPDLTKEVTEWRKEKENRALQKIESENRNKEEKMWAEFSNSDNPNVDDIIDVPAERFHVEENTKMRYFLIGVDKNKPVPDSGYNLLIVMPGGDGSAEFHPFIRRIWKFAVCNSNFIVAQPIAVVWNSNQRIVWLKEKDKFEGQEFSTETFIESIINDVSKRVKIDPKHINTLSWSSSGMAAYAISLQEKTAVTGSYIAMSVFKPNQLPPLENAKGRLFVIQHSPDDRVCPFRMAKDAEQQLTEHGAKVKFTESSNGHGWSGNVFRLIRENINWLQQNQ